MSKTTEALRAIGIFNPHGVLSRYVEANGGTMPVAIIYQPQELGRVFRCASWRVIRPGFETDPKAHWQDHGQKTFTVVYPQRDRGPKLEEAKAWAAERYGVTEWASIPGLPGAKFPVDVAVWMKRTLKATS